MTLQQGILFASRYLLESKLGEGGFGEVWKALDQVTGKYVAIKIHLRGDTEYAAQEIVKEYTSVMNIHHDNLLTPSHVDITDGKVPFLVMELCEGDISELDLSEKEVWLLIRDVSHGLKRLSDNKRKRHRLDGTEIEVADPIIHQDIKPSNILRRHNGMYAISDFGISMQRLSTFSTNYQKDQTPRIDGAMTVDYAAPERFPQERGLATPASDIWSFGATLFEVVEGRRPFAEGGGDCLNPHIGLAVPAITREGYSDELKQVIYDCMAKNPADRPTATQLYDYSEKILSSKQRKRETKSHHRIITITLSSLLIGIVGFMIFNKHTNQASTHAQQLTEECTDTDSIIYNKDTVTHVEKKEEQKDNTLDQPPNSSHNNPHEKVTETLSLPYGEWIGREKNGKPDGKGVLIIKKAHTLNGVEVEPGYRIECVYEDGILIIGKIFDNNNNLIRTIMP